MLYLGIFCFLYYIVIRVYTKRRNSTFLLFWFFAGVICLLTAYLKPYYPQILQKNMWILLTPWCFFVIGEVFICSAMFQVPSEGLKYIVVLGAQIRGTKITNSLARRLDKAYEYLSRNPDTVVIVSGGCGKGEGISEARAMADDLIARGISKNRILLEEKSTSTSENLVYSGRLIADIKEPIGVVTNNFHVYRAMKTAKKCGYTQIQGIVATSNPVLFLNYMVREFFACCYYDLRGK